MVENSTSASASSFLLISMHALIYSWFYGSLCPRRWFSRAYAYYQSATSECHGLRPGCYMAEFEVLHGVHSVEDGHHEPPHAPRRRHRPSLSLSPVDLAHGADGWGDLCWTLSD
jgi:hypothetical protein